MPVALFVLFSFNASAQNCIPFSEINKVLNENIKNEHGYYCRALKRGEKRYIYDFGKTSYPGVISNVDSAKLEASLKLDPPSWLKDKSKYDETKTLPCSRFLSDPEQQKITSVDPKIAEGQAKLSKLMLKQCPASN